MAGYIPPIVNITDSYIKEFIEKNKREPPLKDVKCAVLYSMYIDTLIPVMRKTGCVSLEAGYYPQTLSEHYVILAGPWTGQARIIVESVKKYAKRIIWYALYEGYPKLSLEEADYISSNIHAVVAPSAFVKRMVELRGIRVDGIVPHQIDIEPRYKEGAAGYLYIGRYQKRKYPPHIWDVLCKWRDKDKLFIHTSATPYDKKELFSCGVRFSQGFKMFSWADIQKLYMSHKVYISFASTGGFELTPFEAILHGALVAEPAIEAHRGIVERLMIETVQLGEEYDYEDWPHQIVPIYRYDVEELLKKAEKLQYEVDEEEKKERWRYNVVVLHDVLGDAFSQFRQYF